MIREPPTQNVNAQLGIYSIASMLQDTNFIKAL